MAVIQTVEGLGRRYVVEKVPPLLPLWVQVAAGGRVLRELALGKLSPGEIRETTMLIHRFEVPPMARFRVVDPAGDPVEEAKARVEWGNGWGAVSVGADGAIEFEPHGEKCTLRVRAPGFAPVRLTLESSRLADDYQEIVLQPSSLRLEVEVLVGVRGLPGVSVTAQSEGPGQPLESVVETDTDGRAVFSDLDPDASYTIYLGMGRPLRYGLRAENGDDLVPEPPVVEHHRPGADRVVFQAVRPAAIRGRVEVAAAAKSGLEGEMLFANRFETDTSGRPTFGVRCAIGRGGSFLLAGLPSGSYRFFTNEAGGVDDPLATVELRAEQQRDGVVIRIPGAGSKR